MAIEQVHAFPIMMNGVIGLSHGHGHIIFGDLKAFSPHFFSCTWSMTLFKKES
jgi:hypothetical protein